MNQFEDPRSEGREVGGNADLPNQNNESILPSASPNTNTRSELSSSVACARYIVATFVDRDSEKLNQMRGILDEPFFNLSSSVQEREVVIAGVADALLVMVENYGSPWQLTHLFEAARQILGHARAEDHELKEVHEKLGQIIVKLLGTSNEETELKDIVESSELRTTLYQIAQSLMSFSTYQESLYREQLERIVLSNMVLVSDQLCLIEPDGDISMHDLTLIEAMASCCEATRSSFFDESLTLMFDALWERLGFDQDEEIDSELNEENGFELTTENAACAVLRALIVCQDGDTQVELWKDLIEEFDSVDELWGIALAGISKVEPEYVYPYMKDLLAESANYELTHVPRAVEDDERQDDSVTQHFTILIDLLAVNPDLLPGLTDAMNALDKRQQRAIGRVYRQAVESGLVEFGSYYSPDVTEADLEEMLREVLVPQKK
jgi:hypothetical protein